MAKKSMEELVAYAIKRAKQHIRYSQKRGMSWKTHCNCHWFTSNVYKDCGYDGVYKAINHGGKPHFYKKPWAKNRLGKYLVSYRKKGLLEKNLKPGDIVVRKLRSGVGYHSAIYIGNGKVAEATRPRTRIGKLTKKYTHAFRVPEGNVSHKDTYQVVYKKGLVARKSPTTKSERVCKVEYKTKLTSSKKKGTWLYFPKIKGWLHRKGKNGTYLKKVK